MTDTKKKPGIEEGYTIRFTPDLKKAIKRKAEEETMREFRKVTYKEVIIKAIREYVKEEK